MWKYPYSFIVLFCCWTTLLWSQRPDYIDNSFGPDTTSFEPREFVETERDTYSVFYYYLDNPFEELTHSDTTLKDFHQYDPIFQQQWRYANLGTMGTPHQRLWFENSEKMGFEIGYHQFDLYNIKTHQVKFYRLNTAFSEVSYFQGPEQADGYSKVEFGRNFAQGVGLHLQYNRQSQLGELYQYPHQKARNTAFALGLSFQNPNSRYTGYFATTVNANEQQDNGGIVTFPTEDDDGNITLTDATIQLSSEEAKTRHTLRDFAYIHSYQINQDSVITNAFKAVHKIRFQNNRYRFSDSQDNESYYGDFYTDSRGVRNHIHHRLLENTFQLSVQEILPNQPNQAKTNANLLEAGLHHKFHWLNQEPLDTTIHELFLKGRWHLDLKDRLFGQFYAHFGLFGRTAGDYLLKGNLTIDLHKLGKLQLQAANQLSTPSIIQQRLYVTQQLKWNNNWKKTLSSTLSADYTLPQSKTTLIGSYHLLNNYIYWDELAVPQQQANAFSLFQLGIRQHIQFGLLHSEHHIAIQRSTSDVVRLPLFFTYHNLYLEGKIFKKALEAQVGLDLRLRDAYYANYYHPLIGQFILQNDQQQTLYPMIDAFANIKVKTLRFFAKAENLYSFFSTRFYEPTAYYPEPLFYFRLGASWQLRN